MSKLINLSVGDSVTTTFYEDEKGVVRKITSVEKDFLCGSGYRASADEGVMCKCCGNLPAVAVEGVDAAWFKPVE